MSGFAELSPRWKAVPIRSLEVLSRCCIISDSVCVQVTGSPSDCSLASSCGKSVVIFAHKCHESRRAKR